MVKRSVEDILIDIHNTLTEGLEAILSEVKEIKECVANSATTIEGPVKVKVREFEPAENGEEHPDPEPEGEKFKECSQCGSLIEVNVSHKCKPKKVETEVNHDDVSKDISEWIEKHPGCTAAQVVKEHGISLNRATAAVKKYGGGVLRDPTVKVSVEMLRAKIDEFIAKFGMNEALKVNDIFGGAKKVSQIPEKKYAAVHDEMDRRLREKEGVDAAEVEHEIEDDASRMGNEDPPEATIDDVRKAAQGFVDKYGDPAFRELLARFVKKGTEAKISKLSPEQYPAVMDALTNA